MGKISEQFVRIQSKPLISEINKNELVSNSTINQTTSQVTNIEEVRQKTPKYKITKEPAEGVVEFLVAEIELPNIVNYYCYFR